MSYNTTHIINPKPCAYWSSYSNLLEYFSKETLEFFLQKNIFALTVDRNLQQQQ